MQDKSYELVTGNDNPIFRLGSPRDITLKRNLELIFDNTNSRDKWEDIDESKYSESEQEEEDDDTLVYNTGNNESERCNEDQSEPLESLENISFGPCIVPNMQST